MLNECLEDYDFGDTVLFCHLPRDHEGLHYDSGKNISWKEGKP